MKKTLILCLLAVTCIATQAKKQKDIIVRGTGVRWIGLPESSIDEQSGLKTIEWPSTENNSWHENIGIIDNVPVVEDEDMKSIYNLQYETEDYVPMAWSLTDEGEKTVLHCYFMMKSDIVTNLWLGNAETTILDKETGIIYQAQATVPECCYNKVFSVKGKAGTALDLQIIFPKLPENAKDLIIYGVPAWRMRGTELQSADTNYMSDYDSVPNFHLAHLVKDSVNYNDNHQESWAVYKDAHTIKPVEEKTMAIWRTPYATYLAIATEQNWFREFYGRGGNTILLDNQGHQYKCKGVMGYPNNNIFWLEGYPGDYFAIVLIFEPIPKAIKTFTYILPEGEPFDVWGADWSGEVINNLDVNQLRRNQKLFKYHPRVVVK